MSSKHLVSMIVLLLLISFSVWAQTGDLDKEDLLNPTQDTISKVQQDIPDWEAKAKMYSGISVCIFFLGLFTAALQHKGVKNLKWSSSAVFILGLVVTGLTWWLNQHYAADHRTYRKSKLEAEFLIGQLDTRMRVFRSKSFADDDDKNKTQLDYMYEHVAKEITPLTEQLHTLQTNLIAANVARIPQTVYAEVLPATLSARGAGDCNLLAQSEENSRIAATEKLIVQLVKSAGLTLGPGDLDRLRSYVSKYSTKTQVQGGSEQFSKAQSVSSPNRFETILTLNPTFANPKVVGNYLETERKRTAAPLRPEQRIETIRQQIRRSPRNLDVDGFIERTMVIPSAGGDVAVKAQNPKDGSFIFRFGLRQAEKSAAVVFLQSVEIHEDASGGSTRWNFEILHQGRVIISLPLQTWDDKQRPTRCTIDPDAGFQGTANVVKDGIELTIVGLKPKLAMASY